MANVVSSNQPKLVIDKRWGTAQFYVEQLGEGVTLEMMEIPGGGFLMGSPDEEDERITSEDPLHEVEVQQFFLGKYQITQSQWQAVAVLPEIEQKLGPNPSHFKGGDRPVENISWYEAVEFCARLTKHTKRNYRLPSEAEWEYACRAGTSTPFHFGETITTDLANYRGTDWEEQKWLGSYGRVPKGIYRKETTPVGSFKVANAFGLYDMHGNVWEWCEDRWHENYTGAPAGGTPWNEGKDSRRVLRGGSWDDNPRGCLSASRFRFAPDDRFFDIGFRVACSPARLSS